MKLNDNEKQILVNALRIVHEVMQKAVQTSNAQVCISRDGFEIVDDECAFVYAGNEARAAIDLLAETAEKGGKFHDDPAAPPSCDEWRRGE